MSGSQETYNKKDKEKKRLKKRVDKQKKLAERKANSPGGGLDNMIAYVDENGRITNTPPDPANRTKIDASSIEIGVPKREAVEAVTIRTGRVDYFNSSKGFGFIKEIDSQEKYFVHVNNLSEEITENDKVTFEVERGFKGLSAVRVKKCKT
ncbi:MAG: cold shock domain-containing protein [Bacteroidales bacterium]|nr:cold shock domain-containing protein [Bacteroidales bacterium]MDD4602518.1 cold shock domain-containing protein [Bacteroidales bacterium]